MKESRGYSPAMHKDEKSSPHQLPLKRKAFQCRICKCSFERNEHLVRHVRSHTREKPFKCLDCGACYSRRDTLLRHRRDVRCTRMHNRAPHESTKGTVQGFSLFAEPTDCQELFLAGDIAHNTNEARLAQTSVVEENIYHGPCRPPGDQTDPLVNQQRGCYAITEPLSSTSMDLNLDMSNPEPFLRTPLLDFDQIFDPLINDHDVNGDILGFDVTELQPLLNGKVDNELEHTRARSVQQLWFSEIPQRSSSSLHATDNAGPMSSVLQMNKSFSTESINIDNRCRLELQQRMKISVEDPVVPSTTLLNIWIRLYFEKVHPILPIVHKATFEPSRGNTSLLIAMCLMGSLFTGSDQRLQQGRYLFERIQKAILLDCEGMLAKHEEEIISILQCVVICQVFGLLSGNPELLLSVHALHGPPIVWAKHLRLKWSQHAASVTVDDTGSQLAEKWHNWARREELLRLTQGLYIIDAELASMLHHEPFQNLKSYGFEFAHSDEAFNAMNSESWKKIQLAEMQWRQPVVNPASPSDLFSGRHDLNMVPPTSILTALTILEAISMQLLSQDGHQSPDQSLIADCEKKLADFQRRFLTGGTYPENDRLQLQIMWHTVHLTMFADLNMLEQAVGRDGTPVSPHELALITSWANSDQALKCILHGLSIKRCLQQANVTSEYAIHIPRAIFWSGITLFCYLNFGSPDISSQRSSRLLQFAATLNPAEISVLGAHQSALLSEMGQMGDVTNISLKMTMFSLSDLLQQIGHWEISRKFGAILVAISSSGLE